MPLSLNEFVESLTISGLMSAQETQELRKDLATRKPPPDVQALAQQLVRSGKLTKFQANAIYQGKAKGLVCGEYVLLEKIGAGGMGQVFKARHKRMNRFVAIKLLAPHTTVGDKNKAVKRFHQEVETAARLLHHNIVTAYDAGEEGGLQYLVMEYVAGQDLATCLKPDKQLPLDQALEIVLQAARGLEYAHGQGVVHRDIKPSNLLLDKKGKVKILDMGLARAEDALTGADRAAGEGLTQSGEIMGTVDYMAPEQARNTRDADARADIYSLGCTLYRLATGRVLFDGKTIVDKILAHHEKPAPPLAAHCPGASRRLEQALQRMLAKKPGERFQSMTEVIAELDACRQEAPEEEHAPLVTDEPVVEEGLASFLSKGGRSGLLEKGASLPPLKTDAALCAQRSAAQSPSSTAKWNVTHAALGGGGLVIVGLVATIVVLLTRGEPQPSVPESVAANTTSAAATADSPPAATPAAEKSSVNESLKSEPAAPGVPPELQPMPPVATVPPATQTPQVPATVAPEPSFALPAAGVDLLEVLARDRTAMEGKWYFDGSALAMEPNERGRLEFPQSVPPEFDLHVEATTLPGSQLAIGLVVGSARPAFVMRQDHHTTGLGTIEGKQALDENNPTFKRNAFGFISGQPMTLVCQVRPTSVLITLNGRPVADWKGDPQQFGATAAGVDRTRLALSGSHGVRFTQCELLPPGGAPRRKPVVAENKAKSGVRTNLLRLLAAQKDNLKQGWKVDDAALTQIPASSGINELQLPMTPPSEYELRVVTEALSDENGFLAIGLVVGTSRAAFVYHRTSKAAGLEMIQGKQFPESGVTVQGLTLAKRERVALNFQVSPSRVRIFMNGQPILDWKGDCRELSTTRGPSDKTKLFLAGSAPGGNSTGSFRFSTLELVPLGVTPLAIPASVDISKARDAAAEMAGPLPANASPDQRVDVALRLHEQAATAQDDALRYTLLDDAIKHASAAGDISLVVDLLNDLARSFQIDATAVLDALLTEIGSRAKTPNERKELVFRLLETAAAEMAEERFEYSGVLVKTASVVASKSTDVELKKEVRCRELEAEAWPKLFAVAKPARETLGETPDDAAANLAWGSYLGVVRKQWPDALTHLSKGSDETVRAAAQNELRTRQDPGAAGTIGASWLDAAEKTTLPERAAYLDRARTWLALGAKKLKPVEQAKLSARYKKLDLEVRKEAGAAYVPRHPLRAVAMGGHWYEYMPTAVSWHEARRRCQQLGGDLVCLETPAECQAIYQMVLAQAGNAEPYRVWLGATEEGHDRVFTWINGAPLQFSDWGKNQPDSKVVGEAVAAHLASAGDTQLKWIDTPPNSLHGCVCEWDR